jgi:hypothetical protein
MKKNLGSRDRQLRYLLAAVLVLVALFAPFDPLFKGILLVLAAIVLITAVTGL